MKIKYDAHKAQTNIQKHGVSFEEAQTALYDPFALVLEDDESIDEERFCLLVRAKEAVF